MNKKRKKRPVTLIEIMIVILLIGLIGGALAYNMTGSMDEGRAFKSRQNQERLHDILMLEYAESDRSLSEIAANITEIVNRCPLLTPKQKQEILKDGWKKDFTFEVTNDDILIVSHKLNDYESK